MGAGARIGIFALALAAVAALVLLVIGAQEEPPAVAVPAVPVQAPKVPSRQRHAETKTEPADAADDPLAPSAAPASADILLTGSVVDAASQPVAGATVRVIAPDGAAAEAKTGADGLFSIRWGPRPRTGFVPLGIVATLGGSRAAFSTFDVAHDAAAEEDVGEFVLEASSSLVVRVADAAGPVAGARVFVGSFFGAVFAAATADDRGVARFAIAPPADAWLFAYAKGRGRARGEIPPGHPPAVPLVLTLTRRTVTVAVVQTPGDLPLAGEVVAARLVTEADGTKLFSSFVPPQEIEPTGPDGTTRVEDVGEEDGLEILRRDREASPEPWRFAGQHVGPVAVAPREATVRIEVPAGRTIRWRILQGDAAIPDEGTLVNYSRGRSGVLPPRGPAALKVEGGELVGAGFPDGRLAGVAETRDGAVATLFAPTTGERGNDVVFARPRRVVVSMKDDTVSPLAGVLVRIKDAGGATAADDETTGDDGTVTFSGLEPGAGKLFVESHSGNPPDVRPRGAVDVSKGDARLDAVLPRVRQVTLRVSVEGERKLPEKWRLLVESLWCEDAVSDDAASEIRFSARPRARRIVARPSEGRRLPRREPRRTRGRVWVRPRVRPRRRARRGRAAGRRELDSQCDPGAMERAGEVVDRQRCGPDRRRPQGGALRITDDPKPRSRPLPAHRTGHALAEPSGGHRPRRRTSDAHP